MKSNVYFIAVNDADDLNTMNVKLKSLIKKSGVLEPLRKGYKAALKMHFGEEGNTGYIRPGNVRIICDEIAARGASAFLSDANTLYRGKRLNSKDHLSIARKHGFTREFIGTDIVIPDDTKKGEVSDIRIDQKYIKIAKICRAYIEADALVAASHLKGHVLTGFGGAIKNVGMGCATREGKLAQHCDVAPVVHLDKCVGCGECEAVCPTDAVRVEKGKAIIDTPKCIGCASCLAACKTMAMFIDFEAGDEVQEKMAEYTLAVLKDKRDKSCFLNFAVRINQECDCWACETPTIAPDIGIFASLDPVSIDKASFDMVNKVSGKDVFRAAHPKQDGLKQLKHAEEIGLGNMDYDLIKVT